MTIVVQGTWTQRRKLKTLAQRSKDRGLARRASALAALLSGQSVSDVSRTLCAARSTLYRWVSWFQLNGVKGLARSRGGRRVRTVTEQLIKTVETLVEASPQTHGYLRSTWSSELLSRALWTHHGLQVHASTVRRVLNRHGFGWRRARPTLHKRDPRKAEKLEAIRTAINDADARTEVFFVDEADIDLNPRIGFLWSRRGQQRAIPTPGQNVKHYLGGALNARTGKLVWVEHANKNTGLFLKLLEAVRRAYRRATRIVFILDNYIIHKTAAVARWLAQHPKFDLLFQPVYYPWINRIERLWKAIHDTVVNGSVKARDIGSRARISDVQ